MSVSYTHLDVYKRQSLDRLGVATTLAELPDAVVAAIPDPAQTGDAS